MSKILFSRNDWNAYKNNGKAFSVLLTSGFGRMKTHMTMSTNGNMSRLIKWADLKKLINTEQEKERSQENSYFRNKFIIIMDTLVYACPDFFEFTFGFMPSIGTAVNLIFIGLISFFMVYWIVQMFKNPEKQHWFLIQLLISQKPWSLPGFFVLIHEAMWTHRIYAVFVRYRLN